VTAGDDNGASVRKCDLGISLISACSPSGIEMVRSSSMPPVPMAPGMPIRRLNLSCLLLGSNRIRIQQRSGFSTLGRTGQKNKQATNQDAEYCLDVHRRLPPPRLSRLRSAIDLRLLPRFHDAGLVTFCPIARRTEIKSSGSNYCKRGQDPNIRSNINTSTNSVGKRLHSIADILLSANVG
jgi:hypothetical protein